MCVGEGEVPAAEMTAAPRRKAATWHRMLLCVLREGRKNGLVVSLFGRFRESEQAQDLPDNVTMKVSQCSL